MRQAVLSLSLAIVILACERQREIPALHSSAPQPSPAVVTNARTSRAAPTSPPADCPSVERVGGSVTEPLEVSRVQPRYPDTSGHRFSGTLVILEAVIDRTGAVHDVRVLRAPKISPPLPAFNAAIVDAISSWRYKPATLNGRPVCVYLTVAVSIHLH